MTVDSSLPSWPDVEARLAWERAGILLGNGASMAVSPIFSYESLFAIASDPFNPDGLDEDARKVFAEFGTENFEEVLSNLIVSGRTCKSLVFPTEDVLRLRKSYRLVKNALLATVRQV